MTLATGLFRVRVRNERWPLCDPCNKLLSAISVVVERLRRIGSSESEDCKFCQAQERLRHPPLNQAESMR